MEERDLPVKEVFAELRRKARERGVEMVDVVLRWWITEEESRQGNVIPICLGEIDRYRPFPLIDHSGCVIGVVTFKLEESEGLNFAIATSRIASFLSNPASPSRLPAVNRHQPQAEPVSCWFQMTEGSEQLKGFNCRVSSRVNQNGHTVYDVVEPGGLIRTVVLWEDQKAEVIVKGEPFVGQWRRDEDGDIQVTVNGGVFAFALPD